MKKSQIIMFGMVVGGVLLATALVNKIDAIKKLVS